MSIFDAAVKGYTTANALIKESRGYAGAVEEYGLARASDPELFAQLGREDRAQNQEVRNQGQYERTTRDSDTTFKEQGVMNLVQGLMQARDSGEDLGEAFDNLQDTLPNLGVDEEDIPELRQKLIDDPAILDQYAAALTDPETRARQAAARQKAQGDPVETENALRKFDDLLSRIDTLESKKYKGVGRSVFGLPGMGMITDGGFGAFGTTPGSDAANFVVQLEALSGDIRSQAFETLKGGGQITEKESEFAAQAIANLSRWGSYEEFQNELKRVRKYMNRLKHAATRRANGQKVAEQIMVDPEDDPNYPSPSTSTGVWKGYVDEVTGMTFTGGNPADPASWSKPETGE